MYTIESLKKINQNYDYNKGIEQFEVDKANDLVKVIEGSRNELTPQVGDIIEYTNKYGDYYKGAHVDKIYNNELYICEQPYIPFVDMIGNDISTSTSGGAWSYIPKDLKLIGKREKVFCDWGRYGGCAGGAFNFIAIVNVWEYDCNEIKFSTKDYEKEYFI